MQAFSDLKTVLRVWLLILFALLLAPAQAVSQENALAFGDGLSFVLPAGWETETLMTEAAPKPKLGGAPWENPDTIALLLRATPTDKSRAARITVLRDSVFDGDSGPHAKVRLLSRLSEVAAQEGYRATKFSGKGTDKGNMDIAYGEITATGKDGQNKIFTAVAINRFPEPDLRCYWQYDEKDQVTRREFETWISSLMFKDTKITDQLWNATPITAEAGASPASNSPTAAPPKAGAVPDEKVAVSANPVRPDTPSFTPLSDKVTSFVANHSKDLSVIEGQNGRGSGFLCELDGQRWLLTNAHVLGNNPKPRLTTMNGHPIEAGAAFVAVDHDICKIAAPNATNALEVMPNIEATAKIGDAIAVLGNPEGAGVIKPLQGKIVGIGPNLIEVDAPFVPGNSGSPIVHLDTGKVIGIATYLVIRKVDNNSEKGVEETIRRFGYRLDSVKTWEPINWARFYAQSEQVAKILTNGEEFANFLSEMKKSGDIPAHSGNSQIQRAVDILRSRIRGGTRMSASDSSNTVREFLGNLRSATRSDIATFDMRTAYDFYRRQIAEETKFRDGLYEGFSKVLNTKYQ